MYAVETIKSGLEHLKGDRTANSSGIEKTNQKKKTARRCFYPASGKYEEHTYQGCTHDH